MQELKTFGVYRFTISDASGKPELLISIKKEYQGKPLYEKALQRQFDKNHDTDNPYLLKYSALRDVEGFGRCLVVEWEDARPLSEFIASNPSVEQKKNVLEQLATALGYLHERKTVHGDLSPAVVFITKNGNQARLLNFQQQYAGNQDDAAQVIRYQAPEVKDGTVALTVRSDMYALGMLMKDLRLGGDYYDVVSRCCSYNSSQRFSTMDEFVDALNHRRPSRSSSSSAKVAMPKVSKGFMRVVAVLLALAVVVGIVVYFVNDADLLGAGDTTAATVSADTTATVTAQDTTSAPVPTQTSPTEYTGELEFLATLVPQMQKDIDKMYAPYSATSTDAEKKELRGKVARYYRGLRKTLGKKSQEQFDAFDKAFAEYKKTKDGALQ